MLQGCGGGSTPSISGSGRLAENLLLCSPSQQLSKRKVCAGAVGSLGEGEQMRWGGGHLATVPCPSPIIRRGHAGLGSSPNSDFVLCGWQVVPAARIFHWPSCHKGLGQWGVFFCWNQLTVGLSRFQRCFGSSEARGPYWGPLSSWALPDAAPDELGAAVGTAPGLLLVIFCLQFGSS